MDMTTSETLNRAADLIEERGWGKGAASWGGCPGVVCIDEALARALGFTGCNDGEDSGVWPEDLARTDAAAAVRSHLGLPDFSDLYLWNDAFGRTSAEVIEVLRAAAVIEAARESATEREAASA